MGITWSGGAAAGGAGDPVGGEESGEGGVYTEGGGVLRPEAEEGVQG